MDTVLYALWCGFISSALMLGLLSLIFKKSQFFSSFKMGAHRGSHRLSPENSIEAFQRAKDEGADLIEFDIQETKDGVPIIHHDFNTRETTGVDMEISEYNWEALRELKLLPSRVGSSSNWSVSSTSDSSPSFNWSISAGSSHSIPSFEEAVQWCIRNDMKMMWDVKTASNHLIDVFSSTIRAHSLHSKVVVSSFDPTIVYRLKSRDPGILTGYTYRRWSLSYSDEDATLPLGSATFHWIRELTDDVMTFLVRSFLLPSFLGVDMILVNKGDCHRTLSIEAAHHGMHLVSWTLNDNLHIQYTRSILNIPYLTDDPSIYNNPNDHTTLVHVVEIEP